MACDSKRTVRLKGYYGEVEIVVHDAMNSRYTSSNQPLGTDQILARAIEGYQKLVETEPFEREKNQ